MRFGRKNEKDNKIEKGFEADINEDAKILNNEDKKVDQINKVVSKPESLEEFLY